LKSGEIFRGDVLKRTSSIIVIIVKEVKLESLKIIKQEHQIQIENDSDSEEGDSENAKNISSINGQPFNNILNKNISIGNSNIDKITKTKPILIKYKNRDSYSPEELVTGRDGILFIVDMKQRLAIRFQKFREVKTIDDKQIYFEIKEVIKKSKLYHFGSFAVGQSLPPSGMQKKFTSTFSALINYESQNTNAYGLKFLPKIPLLLGVSLKTSRYSANKSKLQSLTIIDIGIYTGYRFNISDKTFFTSPIIGYKHYYAFYTKSKSNYNYYYPSIFGGLSFDYQIYKNYILGLSVEYMLMIEKNIWHNISYYFRIGIFF
jgi:hypothetical protein